MAHRCGCATSYNTASKQVKWLNGIEFLAHYSEIGSGYGGYSEDHKFFGRHQTI